VCIRGEIKNLGPKTPRGFLKVASIGPAPSISTGSSGRLELARWIASADNPLTARVAVNRIWSRLFGRGLVASVDQFGATGDAPSHPELLDFLAVSYIENGWSTKSMIREIARSKTYQRSSERSAEGLKLDPENRLLSSQNRRRMDAESIHDAVLSLAGRLDLTMEGDSVRPKTKSEYGYAFDGTRRAIYQPVFRNRLHELFAVFDFPDPNLSTGRRNVSTLSTQALFLMNSEFVMSHSRSAAKRLLDDKSISDALRIRRLFESAYGRPPRDGELKATLAFLEEQSRDDEESRLDRWAELCQAVIASIDFRYID
jgi:hypothetical protein